MGILNPNRQVERYMFKRNERMHKCEVSEVWLLTCVLINGCATGDLPMCLVEGVEQEEIMLQACETPAVSQWAVRVNVLCAIQL